MVRIAFDGVENVRDLGGIPAYGGRLVKSGLFLRGANLNGATESDKRRLFGLMGVDCVIDLRIDYERAAKPEALPTSVRYVTNPFYGLEEVGVEFNTPAKNTRPVGRDFACDPQAFYADMANPLTVAQIGKAVRLLLEQGIAGKPTYFHCSGGKDRAGITAACLLFALGASAESIVEDYLLTNVSRDAMLDKMFARFSQFTDDEEYAWELVRNHAARPENLTTFFGEVKQRYHSLDAFLEIQLGVGSELREQAIEACTTQSV